MQKKKKEKKTQMITRNRGKKRGKKSYLRMARKQKQEQDEHSK